MLEGGICVGRICHYVHDGQCHAALMVKTSPVSNLIGLRVFGEGIVARDRYEPEVGYEWPMVEATWHWGLDHRGDG